MRQRKVKNRDAICEACAAWIADDPKERKGRWREAFADPSLPLHVEIGSGKGRFICEMARLHPEINFLAVEGGAKINVRILQKAKDYNLSNLLVIMSYIEDARDFFAAGELDRIYLNFSDLAEGPQRKKAPDAPQQTGRLRSLRRARRAASVQDGQRRPVRVFPGRDPQPRIADPLGHEGSASQPLRRAERRDRVRTEILREG